MDARRYVVRIIRRPNDRQATLLLRDGSRLLAAVEILHGGGSRQRCLPASS
jgi:hypothetical protein